MKNIKSKNIWISILLIGLISISCQQIDNKTQRTTTDKFQFEEITIFELQKGFKNGDYTISDVVQAYLGRIKAIDQNGPRLNSIIQVNPDALKIAEELDKEMAEGKIRGPMHGIPIILKDNIDTHDKMATTAGSRALADSYALQDSFIVKKLRDAGAVILAKANLSEWANFRDSLSSSGWSGLGGQTRNPYIIDRNPCGSSSGSAVAVSANLCMVAIGTETNGSIVCPSTANGIVGIKPTVGLLSRSGIIPISFTQDTPGPMARTITDAAICLGVMTGIDKADSKTLDSEKKYYNDYTQYLAKDGLMGKRIGWYKKPSGRHYKVDKLMEQTVEYLKSQGVEIVEIESFTDVKVGGLSFTVMLYEFKDGLNQYFGSRGPDTLVKSLKELIEFNKVDPAELKYFGQSIFEASEEKGDLETPEYNEALVKMLTAMREEGIDRVMDEHNLDAIIAPTGGPAWKTDLVNGDSFHVGSSSPAAIAGYPNITVPMGFIDGLPVGVSFFGRAWSEPVLIEIAYAYEQGTNHRRVPQSKISD
ncbi:MAG: amidase [Planctomycetota bacterium]|jgi:amidase